jgi:hypothetical protein
MKHQRMIKFRGTEQTLREWAEHLGLKEGTLYDRLRRGWPIEDVLTPARPYHRNDDAQAREEAGSS